MCQTPLTICANIFNSTNSDVTDFVDQYNVRPAHKTVALRANFKPYNGGKERENVENVFIVISDEHDMGSGYTVRAHSVKFDVLVKNLAEQEVSDALQAITFDGPEIVDPHSSFTHRCEAFEVCHF
ncbi:hypothetical protein [Actinomyces vulturis]|uniref:hypothetical protein n=1 Tax=Actinomyces vulturis TaxID=1857645 RepID=UPI000831D56C|nr:hypothetical protein [Actinomyces vulturis]